MRSVLGVLLLGLVIWAWGCSEDTEVEATPALVAGDVTFLMPLGGGQDFGASTVGGHGELLSRAQFDQIETLTRVDEPDDLYSNLHVVAVRLDPCFFEGEGEVVCSSQVRLVMQPVFREEGAFTSRDATVHAFYEVPTEEIYVLADRLAQVRVDAGGQEGIGEHLAPEQAVALVLPHVGVGRLSRLTFVAVHASDEAWTFGGFDIVDGEHKELELPGVEGHEQHLTSTGGERVLDATILPEPTIETDAAIWLTLAERETLDEDSQAAAVEGLQRLLDPAEHNPGTVDCASCHMATTGMYFANAGKGEVPEVYANSQNQRMLGFFGETPSISPRVQAETQAVLEFLRQMR